MGWANATQIDSLSWGCGYCGKTVGGDKGYYYKASPRDEKRPEKLIYICPYCENPTAFIQDDAGLKQIPGAIHGNDVSELPLTVKTLYDEVRRCVQYTAYTAAVLSMRKLLVHIAVDKGAKENKPFIYYIEFLDDNHWIPPSGNQWVDSIRKAGNEAAHEIVILSEHEARQLLDFTEMLLKIIYEFPMKLQR